RFYGFASEAQMQPTVESELFKAFEKTRLLIGNKKESQYSRCGRTDKGVSSVGQVIDMLLDTTRIVRKPQYTMATEVPLVLQCCEFDDIKFICSSDAGDALRLHLVNECQIYQLQTTIFHEALLNCVPLSNDQSLLPFQATKKKVSHVPLMSRPTEREFCILKYFLKLFKNYLMHVINGI
ncbi:hypothetical protein LR48_Vigan02g198100, partial [Vigna angularis]